MDKCSVLRTIYGRDTRPAQWLNVIVSLLWVAIGLLVHAKLLEFNLPENTCASLNKTSMFFAGALLFSLCNFFTVGKTHQIIKAFSFALGALANAVIANSYIQAYPPVDPMMFFSLTLCLLFLLAVFYILSCEGLNGCTTQ